MYCLTRKTLKCNSLVQKLCLFLQKETSHWRNNLALGPQKPKQYIFGDQFYLKNAKKLRFHVFLLFHVRKHVTSSLYLKWTKFTRNCQFCSNCGSPGTRIELEQIHNFLRIRSTSGKMFYIIKIEEYMEPKLSGFFWVKMVVKNIVLRSLGTHFMHVRVKQTRSSIETNVIGVKKYIYISLFKFYWKACKIKVEKKKVKVILTVNIGYAWIYLNKQGYS